MNPIEYTFEVKVKVDVDADAKFPASFSGYLTDAPGPFMDDYGPDAWGGYEGPKVVGTPEVRNVTGHVPDVFRAAAMLMSEHTDDTMPEYDRALVELCIDVTPGFTMDDKESVYAHLRRLRLELLGV